MKRQNKIGLIALAALLLVGCRTEMAADVYTADILDDETLSTPAVMKMEISSCTGKKRAEYEQKVLALFDAASEAKLIGCSRQSGKSMLSVGFSAEITDGSSSADFILYRERLESESWIGYAIKPGFSSSFLQRVDTMLKQNLQKLNSRNVRVAMVINNDLKDDVLISARNVWVDGEPMESFLDVPIKRRGRLILTLPDITSDLIIRNRKPVAFEVKVLN